MIRSMTGFGKAERITEGATITVEIRSLNSRFLDLTYRAPRIFLHKENELKEYIKKRIDRGKITLNVLVRSGNAGLADFRIDHDVVRQHTDMLRQAAAAAGLSEEIRLEHLLRFEDIFVSVDGTEEHEALWKEIVRVIDLAIADLNDMREREGAELGLDLKERIGLVESKLVLIESISKSAVQEEMKRLEERLAKLLARTNIDPQRLDTEIAILADKVDVTEELVRFRSHNKMFRDLTEGPSAQIGRKLNFIIQEMGREANTIGSKASQPEVIHAVVAIKEELEKLREQVQNVE